MEASRSRLREYGLPTAELGASGGQIIMAALLPILLEPHARSAVWIGVVVAADGLFAVLVPYVVGALSDSLPPRLERHFGRRTFFLLLAAPFMAGSLALVPFLDGYWATATVAFVFFAALHTFTTPLFALVVDSVPEERWGRVHGIFGALRAGGLAYGLVGGGLLLTVWQPLPFLVAGALVLGTTAVTFTVWRAGFSDAGGTTPEPDRRDAGAEPDGGRDGAVTGEGDFWREVARRPAILWFLVFNMLTDAATDGLRPYIFLFATTVLGITVAESSLVLIFLLAGVAVGSIVAGRLGDRLGRGRVLLGGTLLLAVVLAGGALVRTVPAAMVGLVPAGLGAATLAVLPYPVFAELARTPTLGRYTGVFRISTGVARLVAPLVLGIAIDYGAAMFPQTGGYPLMWLIAGGCAFLGAIALWRADRAAGAERV